MKRIPSVIAVSLFLSAPFFIWSPAQTEGNEPAREWRSYQGGPHRNQYSELDQINTHNVDQLQVAWEYHTGDKSEDGQSQIQCNPIIVDGIMYVTSPAAKAIALDAATGKEIWKFDPFQGEGAPKVTLINRGVNYWESDGEKRILFAAHSLLYSLDAKTGKPDPGFGESGSVDLHKGLGRDDQPGLYVTARTPGAVYKDLLILGSVVSEGHPAAPGDIRAYDIRSGEIKWIFHTIPHPGEFGYDTWPEDAWKKIGGANSWSGISVDEKRGMVFVPTGSPAFDFYGGNRPGKNLFGNCILALKADTGERVWHFQVVRHDIWDRDLPAPPNLVTVEHDGKRIDAVAQITKSGHVFLLNRDSGEPLFPVEERVVAESDLPGEVTWPTQPFPVKPKPFARQIFTEDEITNISPEAHAFVAERFKKLRTGPPFTVPSKEGTIIFPGFDGGGEWGGAAFDQDSGIMYVNAQEMPWVLTMLDVIPRGDEKSTSLGESLYRMHCASCHGADRKGDGESFPSLVDIRGPISRQQFFRLLDYGSARMPAFQHLSPQQQHSIYAYLSGSDENVEEIDAAKVQEQRQAAAYIPYTITGYHRFNDQNGYPAVKPPWGTLNALNLNTGEILWQVVLGEFKELTAKGIPQTGTENYGGPVVTAGGLIFIGATKDEMFRAFDKETGGMLWETKLPAGGYATPATYEVDGRQFVAIAAGGGKLGTKPGDSYVAFALPAGLRAGPDR
ncbi:MAG: PQQ-binding-like beta-propeller repeat protein [Acidobacteriota bacterium]